MIGRRATGLTVSDRIRTMGYDGLHLAALDLHDCDLPEENVILPPENAGVLDLLRMWENEVLLAAALVATANEPDPVTAARRQQVPPPAS